MIVDHLSNNNDAGMIKISLEALENLLENSKQMFRGGDNPYLIRLAQRNGYAVIENLQSHPNVAIYDIVSKFIEKHLEFETA